MKTYVTINNDQSIVYFTGEDADADICHQNLTSVHQWNILKLCKSLLNVSNYTFLEILSDIRLAEDSAKDNCALTTLL